MVWPGGHGMLPRAHEPAPDKRKIGCRERIANGTAGQTQAFSLANPVGSVGFGELLVRASAPAAVRKYRGRVAKPPPDILPPENGSNAPLRVPRNRWRCTSKTIRDANDALCGRLRV